MPGKLIYVPLEPYLQRYTFQWAAPKTGWQERNWIKHKVKYLRIDGDRSESVIKTGSVVDAVGRSKFCFSQIERLLNMASVGGIKDEDCILFDDFWTPGFEALPYAFHLLGIKPRIYAFLHAQSVDQYDFTYPMRTWMRPIEIGMAEAMTGIFVCCYTLKNLLMGGGVCKGDKIHVTGHPFSSEEVMERMPGSYQMFMSSADTGTAFTHNSVRNNQVVWSSRWDEEKNPTFFLELALKLLDEGNAYQFVICTSAPQLRSNSPVAMQKLKEAIAKYPMNIVVCQGLTKEQYYNILTVSKIQFNCANQDFVAITLLESSVAGCYPIYPEFRSFPETFHYDQDYMYEHLNLNHAANKIKEIMTREDLWMKGEILKRAWIHQRFDYSWARMLDAMQIDYVKEGLPEYNKDPFASHLPFVVS